MPSILSISAALAVAYFSTFIYCFIRNFFNARKSGFPCIYIPFDQNHFVWMIISVPLRPWFQRRLPTSIYNLVDLCTYGFEFRTKLRPFQEYAGPRGNDKSFMLVTAGRAELSTCDPEIVTQILNRPRDFMQHELTDLFMAIFGHNLLTSNGDRWTRQRKIVASVINERISKTVFTESIQQTEGLVRDMTETAVNGAAETVEIFDMVKKIAIHVLSGAGMGASVSWADDKTEQPPPGFKQTYIQSVKNVLEGINGPILLPHWFLSNYPSWLPGCQVLKAMQYAVEEFPVHTTNLLEQERQRTESVTKSRSNIMSQLLQASERADDTGSTQDLKRDALSDEEMMGNLFVFTAAGFDTTANTVNYALVLLARYPLWQEWLLEEVDTMLPSDPTKELEYTEIFPRATRLMAFMLETMRLFTPLVHIAKQTRAPQTIQTSESSYWVPANTTTYINTIALHLDPEVWRNLNLADDEKPAEDDAFKFRPGRWINPPGSQQALFQPPKGTFVPWSGGPRVCPGQKMAQVEFVAIFLTLLRDHKIDAVPLDGESRTDVDKRLDHRMQNSTSVLTLQMNDVYNVSSTPDKGLKLRLSKRR